ncbi:MAG: VOC family protein [Polyangiaceae bacterium]
MSNTIGRVVWRECMTKDVNKAKGFYGELFGWKFDEMKMEGMTYNMIKAGDNAIGGLMALPADVPAPPHFASYVSVKDVDAAANAAKANGGQVLHGPMDVPNMGRFAILADSDMAVIAAWKSAQGDGEMPERPGLHTFCWETLSTKDVAKSKAFYAAVFGWKTESGPGGAEVFTAEAGLQVADIQKAEGMPPNWLTYVVIEKLEAARDKAEKLGAKVLMPLIDVPQVGRIAVIADNQGAVLGLFEPGM